MERKSVVVIGGGISGLTTAHTLATKHGDRFTVRVLEATDRLGGNVRTIRLGDYLIDEGPDSWVNTKPQITALARALGLGDRLIETIPENRKVYVRTERGLVPMPEGLMLGIPTRIVPLATTPLLSWRGKLRAAADLVLPKGFRRAPGDDEPLGTYIERRLGREVLEKLAAPLLGGLYTGDVASLSLMATFPQLAALEEQGGMIRGALALARKAPKTEGKRSAFTTLRGGVGELIDTLAARLSESIQKNARVERLARVREGDRFVVEHTGGERIVADHVVFAGPAHVAAQLIRGLADDIANELAAIEYTSAATVFLAYARTAIAHPLDATGYLVPTKAPGEPLASTWVSSKWPFRAPSDRALMRIFFGNTDVDRADDDLIHRARNEVTRTLSVSATPELVHVARFRRASPQPRVGHPARVARIKKGLESVRGVHVLGSAYDGVGLGDCVRQAEAIAGRIAE